MGLVGAPKRLEHEAVSLEEEPPGPMCGDREKEGVAGVLIDI